MRAFRGEPPVQDGRQSLLLEQLRLNLDTVQTFWEWRHKVLTRYGVAVGGVLFGLHRIREAGHPEWWSIILLAFGGVVSLLSYALNTSTWQIVQGLYANGRRIEKGLKATRTGVFTTMAATGRLTHHGIFAWLYGVSAAAFAVATATVSVAWCLRLTH